jgi:hypothetical protein
MPLILATVIVIGILVVPVMIAARIVNADNKNFGTALLATIVMVVASNVVQQFVPDRSWWFVASTLVGGVIFSAALGTSYGRGVIVSLISSALQYAIFFGLLVNMIKAN